MIRAFISQFASQFNLAEKLIITYFREAGLIHLLAISGIHFCIITIVIFFIIRKFCSLLPNFFLQRDSKKIAAIITILSSGLFLHFISYPISAKRAFTMSSYYLIAKIFYLPSNPLRICLLTLLFLYFFEINTIPSLSFQLSFIATLALIIFFRNKSKSQHQLTKFWLNNFYISLICTLATAPFIIYHFNHFPIYGLIANFIIVPIFSFLFLPAFFFSTAISLYFPENLFISLTQEIFFIIVKLAKFFKELPFSYPKLSFNLLSLSSFTALFWSKLLFKKAYILISFFIITLIFSLLIAEKTNFDLLIKRNGKDIIILNKQYSISCQTKICSINAGKETINIIKEEISATYFLKICQESALIINQTKLQYNCPKTYNINKTDLWFNGNYYLKLSPNLKIYHD